MPLPPLPDNPYEILGVSKNAQIPEIRTAYRKLVLKCHPDKVTDPAQKAIKAEEFQKVQKAYELLSDENEREKYEDIVRLHEMDRENAEQRRQQQQQQQRSREFAPGRTPPRSYDSEYGRSPHYTVHVKPEPGYKVRTAEPPPFQKSSTWTSGSKSPYTSTRTPPRSYEDNINSAAHSSHEDIPRDSRDARRARKAYDEKPSRDEEKRARRREQEEYERAAEKARKREADRKEAERREIREQEKRDKERRKEEKKRAEKLRDTERKRDTEEKRSRTKPPAYVEEEPEYVPKSEKKPKSSSRVKETPQVQVREDREREPRSHRDVKQAINLDFATEYLQASRSKAAPSLQRAQTYHYNVRHVSPPPPAVATPPPANNGMAPPPPQMRSMGQTLEEETDEEPVMRSAARRRMSHDTPRSREKTSSSSHKKSSSREAEYVAESGRPMPKLSKSATMPTSHLHQSTSPMDTSPPKISRSKTEFVRPPPGPMHGMSRQQTWGPGGEDHRERSRSRPLHGYSEDESEEDYRPRRSHRTRSPDEIGNTFTYKVENGRAKPSVRTASYIDEPVSRSGRGKSYYPEANQSRPLDHRPAMHPHDSYSGQTAFKVKTARNYDMSDVNVADVPYSYTPRDAGYGYA
ncbi:hypothetical protein TruAng_003749 [Truncatella angustata]|nr:hypothetical protein TruAng_003749 [Truncatella angustata]